MIVKKVSFIVLLSLVLVSANTNTESVDDQVNTIFGSCHGQLKEDIPDCLRESLNSELQKQFQDEPIGISTLNFNNSADDKIPFHFVIKDLKISGLKNSSITDISVDYETGESALEYFIPLLSLQGHYDLDFEWGKWSFSGSGVFWSNVEELNLTLYSQFGMCKNEEVKENNEFDTKFDVQQPDKNDQKTLQLTSLKIASLTAEDINLRVKFDQKNHVLQDLVNYLLNAFVKSVPAASTPMLNERLVFLLPEINRRLRELGSDIPGLEYIATIC